MFKTVLMCINSLSKGGAEKNFCEIANTLAIENKVFIFLFNENVQNYYISKLNNNIKVIVFKESKFKFIFINLALLRLILKYKPDFVISFLFYADLVTYLPSLITSTRRIVSIRNNYFEQFSKGLKHKILLNLHCLTLFNCYSIVFVTKKLREIYTNKICLCTRKLSVIPNYVEIVDLVPCKESYDSTILRLAFIGRIEYQKNLILLLKSVKSLNDQNIPYKLDVIGDGSLLNDCIKYVCNNNLNDKVKFHGFNKNPFKLICESMVLILPSLYEGFPNVILEAMANRKIVLSSNCDTGPSEIISHEVNGLLFENNNREELEKYLIRIYSGFYNVDNLQNCAFDTAKFFTSHKMLSSYNKLIC